MLAKVRATHLHFGCHEKLPKTISNVVLTPPLDGGLMTVLVRVAFPDPHSELHEPQELHEDTWQSITGEKRQINNMAFNVGKHGVHKGEVFLHQNV